MIDRGPNEYSNSQRLSLIISVSKFVQSVLNVHFNVELSIYRIQERVCGEIKAKNARDEIEIDNTAFAIHHRIFTLFLPLLRGLR